MSTQPWRICVDTGGTFTDCLAVDPAGDMHSVKVLSSGVVRARVVETDGPDRVRLEAEWLDRPEFAAGATLRRVDDRTSCTLRRVEIDGWATLSGSAPSPPVGALIEISTDEEAPVLAARVTTRTPAGSSLPPVHFRLATTRATNALLERKGTPPTLFITRGFADLLLIDDQTRPDIFAIAPRRSPPLHGAVVEVSERLDAGGAVLRELDLDRLRREAAEARREDGGVASVALLHSWRNPAHEHAVRAALLEVGYEHVSISSDLGSSLGVLARAQTAVANAFLSPVIDAYLDRVVGALDDRSELLVMTSGGGLVDRAGFEPKDSLLSGPAAGVVGAVEAGRRAGHDRVISFDMGGTSTDCARGEGSPEREFETRVGDARITAPSVAVETVAAGGGSICDIVRGELRVGPESAGANPGPACYGRGGPLTITDCNLLLGRLAPSRFAVPVDEPASRLAAERLRSDAVAMGLAFESLEVMISAFIELADQRMAEAVRRITIRRGHDPSEHALVAFGGAGPQHACAIADALSIDHIAVPANAPMLSAEGLGVARVERTHSRDVRRPLDDVVEELPGMLAGLSEHARSMLASAGGGLALSSDVRLHAELRFLGHADSVSLDAMPVETLGERFKERFADTFGFVPGGIPVQLTTVRATAVGPSTGAIARQSLSPDPPGGVSRASVYTSRRVWTDAEVVSRTQLAQSTGVSGPALVVEPFTAVFVENGWEASCGESGDIRLSRVSARDVAARPQAVETELAIGKLEAIALEMGERLRRTAISTNVKERRDFSCAILDAAGRLVVNAPHVPVHLGSMGVCVRAVRDRLGPRFGDEHGAVFVTNHPAFGGSHLPDVSVIQPVVTEEGELLAYAAVRAHHAEIGGIAPGSMAPEASRLAEEGVVIEPVAIGRRGTVDFDRLHELFRGRPFPSRSPEINARDLAASIHAAWAGAAGLRSLHRTGHVRLDAVFDRIRSRAAARARELLRATPDGTYADRNLLDDGTPIFSSIEITGDRAIVSFEGTGGVHPGCLNATPAIVTSAVIYVLRLLVGEELPLNEGLLEPVDLRIPEATLLDPPFGPDPARCPAVAGGNVEISQVLVETMLGALRVCAQSQGTMNNVTFGDETFGCYETLGGGAAAGPASDGQHAVHSHMTNTALTDPEVLEMRHPVRIVRCCIRRGSGGNGRHRGGDGLIREYLFLKPVRVSVLAQSRVRAPKGTTPENAAKVGAHYLIADDGQRVGMLGVGRQVREGTRLIVETPGGAGFDPPA